jgi:hypothetical protein
VDANDAPDEGLHHRCRLPAGRRRADRQRAMANNKIARHESGLSEGSAGSSPMTNSGPTRTRNIGTSTPRRCSPGCRRLEAARWTSVVEVGCQHGTDALGGPI